MSRQRIGAREVGYSFYEATPSGSNALAISKFGDGIPRGATEAAKGPGAGRVVALNWELTMPAMAAGADADWNDAYPFVANGTTRLPLITWRRGLAQLGAFTKHNLAIEEFRIFYGPDVTESPHPNFLTTAVRTRLEVDDGGGGFAVVREATAMPDFSDPIVPYATLTWTTTATALLGANYPKAYLSFKNTHGSVATTAAKIRVAMLVYEL